LRNRNHIPGTILFALLIVLPFSAGLIYAFLYSFGLVGILNQGFTLIHWRNVFASGELWRSLAYSFYIAGLSLFIAVALAFLFIMLRRDRNERTSYFIYLPLTLPAMVAAFFTFQFLSNAGFISRIFNALHLTNGPGNFPDMINDPWGVGIIITHVMLALPFFIILFQNYYRSENLETLRDLSLTLGSSHSQFTRKILVPLLLLKTSAPLGLYFLFMLGSYEIPLLLGQQDPQMVSVLVTRKLSRYNLQDIPQGYIIAILYTSVVCGLLLLIMRKKTNSNAANA